MAHSELNTHNSKEKTEIWRKLNAVRMTQKTRDSNAEQKSRCESQESRKRVHLTSSFALKS
jgi:hypothetical protein